MSSYDQYRTTIITAITTGIIILVSLAWNDVVQTTIKTYYPLGDASITGKLHYAFVITFIVILLQIYILPLVMDVKKKC
jgi:hypothetical protein